MLTAVICIGIICSSNANLFFSLPNDETRLSVMTIVNTNCQTCDEVFVAGENMIYKLSANLSQLMNVAVSNDTAVSVRGLSVSYGGQYIVACLITGSCIGYDVISLTSTISSVPLNEPGREEATGNDPVTMFPGQTEGNVYAGTAIDFGTPPKYRMSLGRYKVLDGSLMANKTRDYILQRSHNKQFNTRIFKAGFSIDDFAYYIVEDDGAEIRILRVCNESTSNMFKALYEVHLICGGAALFAGISAILEGFPHANINTLILTVRPPSASSTGRVCTYSMNDINDAMDAGLTACRNGSENREVVWDDFPSSGSGGAFCGSTIVTVSYIYAINLISYI